MHHSFQLENVWYVIHDRKSDVEHRTCIYFIPSWKSNLSSRIFKKINSVSNRKCIFTTPTQLRRYKDSRQNYMTRTKQVDIASRAHSAVSLQSVLNPVLNCRRKLRCEAMLVPLGATLTFLWCFCCSRRRFLSKHILLTHEHVHFAHRWRAFRVRKILRGYCLGQAAWMLPAFKLFFKYFAEPSAKNFRSQVHFWPAMFRLMM